MDKLDPKGRAAALEAFVAAGGGSFIVDMPSRPLDAALQAYEAERAGAGAVPAGWKLVPIKATAENGMKAALIGEYKIKREIPAENPEDHANGEYVSAEFTITWTEMKELYGLFLAAAPTPPSPPLDAAAVRESALREGIDALPRYDGNGGAKLGESVIVPAANGRYVALDDVRALIAPAAPGEGEGRDHG